MPEPPRWLNASAAFADELSTAMNSRTHQERWKYSSPAEFLSLLNSDNSSAIAGSEAVPRQAQDFRFSTPMEQLFSNAEATAALCYANAIDCLEVRESGARELTHTHTTRPLIIRVASGVHLDLVERYEPNSPAAHTVWLELADNASVTHSRNSFATTQHWQFLHVYQAQNSHYCLHDHSLGGELHRQDLQVYLDGEQARAEISCAGFAPEGQHLDQQITVQHAQPKTQSEQRVNHIAANNGTVSFNGRIHIHADAGGSDAQLQNQNLGLSETARINTKPELEIYTDDVQCAHGATVGQLDDKELFYCASRGISDGQARLILSAAFLNRCTAGPLAETARAEFAQALSTATSS